MHAPDAPGHLICRIDGYTDLPPGKLANLVTYLEMTRPPPPGAAARPDLALVPTDTDLDAYRALYRRIGERWLWMGRLVLSDATLARTLADERLVSRTLIREGEAIGLAEILFASPEEAELCYFGLVPEAIGGGAGRWLMEAILAQAFARPIRRLVVHTCTFDHPGAVGFYVRSGFRPYKRAVEIHDDPRLSGVLPREAGADVWPVIEP
ncbi:GNAT family N-acetyltransferase [Salinarimonas ramus]|uniref:N-acetyltransferase n=1 Tax=Salinarimonas ramus TaxID=690164 RepID=A0A917QD17_9HYPH|nr:GNAT family N-acetyltransferase [Salinarimonas ramus]GGK44629.1 N-acetyltransferase [Salinarimonas ramus]